MIKKNTVLVLGAGASMPYGFPSGDELAYEICRKTTDDIPVDTLYQLGEIHSHKFLFQTGPAMSILKCKIKDIYKFQYALATSQLSVDAFLENLGDDLFYNIGKIAIASVLLSCENPDRLFIGKPPYRHFEDMRLPHREKQRYGNWYKLLWERLCDPDDIYTSASEPEKLFKRFSQNNLSVITFNYDRSLEYFLLTALEANTYKKREACKKKLKETIEILHIYGSLGDLLEPGNPSVQFGAQKSSEILKKSAESIELIRRDKGGVSAIPEVCNILKEAKRIIFLGFGFDKDNLKRLGLEEGKPIEYQAEIWGTKMGLSQSTIDRIKRIEGPGNLLRAFDSDMLKNMDAYELIYSENLLN